MTRGLVTSSRYSPGNMTADALERLFVGREPLMKEVLKRIAASATRQEKHFILLVGSRGMGKTHFVSLAYHKLKRDAAYAETRSRLKIAYLNEEEWGVASFLDLLVRILRALATEHGDSGLLARVDGIYQAFQRSPEVALETAESLLTEYIQGSTLLLICENLEDLFEGLGTEGQQRWRAYIQEHPFWTILGTTPALFSGVRLQTSPFYNFFNIKNLERLDFDTALELLRQKALGDGQTRLADFLLTPTGRARVRAIHHLAGGNHRVYVIMSDFLTKESLDDLFTPFMRMADDLTPYYQDRMRQLTPQQRKLVELLSQEARPIIVKDIAARCLISPQGAAKQLGELAKLRFVVSTKVGRESYYELAEPLMRICVDIKDNRTEHFRLFVNFLRHWFTGRELRAKLELLKQVEASARRVDRLHLDAAIQDLARDPREPFLESLGDEVIKCYKARDFEGLADALPRLVDEASGPQPFQLAALAFRALKRFEEAFEYAKKGAERYPEDLSLQLGLMRALADLDRREEALNLAEQHVDAAQSRPDFLLMYANLLGWSGRYTQSLEVLERVLVLAPGMIPAHILKAMAHAALGRWDDSIAQLDEVLRADPHNASARILKADALLELGRTEDAKSLYVAVLHSEADTAFVESALENLFLMGNPQETLEAIGQLEGRGISSTFTLQLKARALVITSRFDEALDIIDAVNRRNGTTLENELIRADALGGAIGFGAALEVLRRILEQGLGSAGSEEHELIAGMANVLFQESRQRGPLAMARQLGHLKNLLVTYQRQAIMPAVLALFVEGGARGKIFDGEEWVMAVPVLQEALQDLPECLIPLNLLSVAIRYLRTRDEAILLELPLEQRTLLTEEGTGQGASKITLKLVHS